MMTESNPLSSPQYPMRVVVRRTGLNASLLRAWERRYGAVEPGRSEGGQRLYSEDDIRRLLLLKELVDGGHNIGQVANLARPALTEVLQRERVHREWSTFPAGPETGKGASREYGAGAVSAETVLERALEAVREMAEEEFEQILNCAALTLPTVELVDRVLLPLLEQIGVLWVEGKVGPAGEHIASGVIRSFLDRLVGTLSLSGDGPVVLVGTPRGHRHEFGALLAGVIAAEEGRSVVPLGPDLPHEEIAGVARRKGASAVVLSAIHPQNDPELEEELVRLREGLEPEALLVVGGKAVVAHVEALEAAGIHCLDRLPEFREFLRGTETASGS